MELLIAAALVAGLAARAVHVAKLEAAEASRRRCEFLGRPAGYFDRSPARADTDLDSPLHRARSYVRARYRY